MAIPEYGALIREIRGRLDKSLRQMADGTGFSATYLSAVEIGERPMTEDFIQKIVGFLRKEGLTSKEIVKVCAAADRSRRAIDVEKLDGDGRFAVAAFARKWDDLDRDARARFMRELGAAGRGGKR